MTEKSISMKTRKVIMMCWMVLFMALPALAAENKAAPPYMGQKPPGLVPKIFAPGLISLPKQYEHDICLSKDMQECYFTVRAPNWTVHKIAVTRYVNGHWTHPVPASFTDNGSLSPSLADNDKSMYFSRGGGIWKAERSISASGTKGGWSPPQPLPAPVGPHQADWGCNISSLGNLWFCSWRPGGLGKCDLWFARLADGQFKEPINLRSLNTDASDCCPLPGPNEDYVIWSSEHPGGFGSSDLYISFADGKGGWTAPKNMGPTINTALNEASPHMSPDHKYLFFSRTVDSKGDDSKGEEDIFWVSVEAFLRDKNKPASDKHD
jgi:hypothetical protein